MKPFSKILFLIPIAFLSSSAYCGETDQYIVWGIELEDSAEAVNNYLNSEAEKFIEKRNRIDRKKMDDEQLVSKLYAYYFHGLHASKLRNWVQHSEDVDRYPETSSVSYFKYMKISIYKRRSFPYILPMARTVRIGDVYLGIDKISHFFGIGRRYFERYNTLRERGRTEEEAMRKVVIVGIGWEKYLVGRLTDGIFSHADLEADFQGFMMARDLCGGEKPNIQYQDGKWKLVRPIDITKYVTPDFDESYNPSHYWALRKRFVLPLLERKYKDKLRDADVQARFARYATYEASFSKKLVDEYFKKHGEHPQDVQHAQVFGVPSGKAAANLTQPNVAKSEQPAAVAVD